MCLHCLRALQRPSFFQKNSPVFLRFGVPLILSKGWQKAGFFEISLRNGCMEMCRQLCRAGTTCRTENSRRLPDPWNVP